MPKAISLPLSLLLLVSLAPALTTSQAPQAAQVPDVSPQIFAPGVISGPSSDGSPAFTPDGNTLFFTRSATNWSIILESHRTSQSAADSWSEPTIASFSGAWNDQQPAMSPDGSHLLFVSTRPANPQQPSGPRGAAIWRVDRTAAGWSQPVRLPDTVNFCTRVFKPTIAGDGSVYFMAMEQGKKFRLFRSQYAAGTYQKAEPLSFSDGTLGSTGDVDPEIAPDESFLLFSSDGRRPDDSAHEHLYIVFRQSASQSRSQSRSWSAVMPVRYTGDDLNGSSNDNESRLSPDRKTLFFSSDRSLPAHFPRTLEQAQQDLKRVQLWDNGNGNVWFMPIAPWLKLGKTGNNT
jgi:Tol biopolymer transport system component